jgi:hypothetical protein
MRTLDLLRRLRFVTVLAAAGLLAAGVGVSEADGGGHMGGGGGGGAHVGGGGHFGGGAHYGGGFGGAHFGGYGYGRGGYYGRGYGGWYGRGYGYWGGCCGWGWWGPGWFGLGLYAAWLPWYYSLYWWDGYPYYYYDNTYYVWNGDAGQYQQVNPPQGFNPSTSSSSPPPNAEAPGPANDQLFAYPKAGQSPEQQARDRDECSRWAAGQVGQQPAQTPPAGAAPPAGAPSGAAGQPSNGAAPASANAMMQHQAYLRAEAACLQARNYTVE